MYVEHHSENTCKGTTGDEKKKLSLKDNLKKKEPLTRTT